MIMQSLHFTNGVKKTDICNIVLILTDSVVAVTCFITRRVHNVCNNPNIFQ